MMITAIVFIQTRWSGQASEEVICELGQEQRVRRP